MIERIAGVPAGIDALRAVGKIAKEDYDSVVIPLIDEAARDGRRLRCLCEVGPDFQGLTPSAAWADLKIGLRALRMIEACAVAEHFVRADVRNFGYDELEDAITWAASPS